MANNDYDRDQYGNAYNRDYNRDGDQNRDPRERLGGYNERDQGRTGTSMGMGSFGERYDREDWRNRENFGQENWRGRQMMSSGGGGQQDQQSGYGPRDSGREYGPGAQRDYGREYNQGSQRDYRRDDDRSYVQQSQGYPREQGSYQRNQGYESRDRGMMPAYGQQYGQGSSSGYTGGRQNEDWRVPGPFTGKGPRGYQRSDERIREEVSDRLSQHGRIDASDMDVQVRNGEVTLGGNANSRDEKRMAEDVAASVQGVTDVNNQIKVKQGFLNQIKDAISGNPNQQPSDQTMHDQTVTH